MQVEARVNEARPVAPAGATERPPAPKVGPLDLLRWIQDAGLSRVETAVGIALIRTIDNATLAWPKLEGQDGGISVARLGRLARYSPRHTRRGCIGLEERGIVQIEARSWQPNRYVLVAEVLRDLAEDRHGLRSPPVGLDAVEETQPEQVERRRHGWASWVLDACRAVRAPARVVDELVRACVAAILGHAPEDVCAAEARRVVKLWSKQDRPEPAALAARVAAVATAARECGGPLWASVRGVRLEHAGEDRSESPRELLRVGLWTDRIAAAEAHAEGRCGCCGALPLASADDDEDDAPPPGPLGAACAAAGLGAPVLVGGDAPPLVVDEHELLVMWARVVRQVAAEIGQMDAGIWLAPLAPVGVVEGALLVEAPNGSVRDFAAVKHGPALVAALGGPVALAARRRRAT